MREREDCLRRSELAGERERVAASLPSVDANHCVGEHLLCNKQA
jgi:hypothetical protein